MIITTLTLSNENLYSKWLERVPDILIWTSELYKIQYCIEIEKLYPNICKVEKNNEIKVHKELHILK